MDRQTVYRGQIVYETDLLSSARYAYEGLGLLALDMLGASTLVSGLACTPTGPASLAVVVGIGRVYELENLEQTAWGAVGGVGGLAADTSANHQILKQGLLRDPVTLAVTAPTTSGFSVNYLIQATVSETDTGSVVLPFFNASDPSDPWAGPGNSGGSLPVVRQDAALVVAKQGTPALTGTQTTPTPDAGYVGLYVVTVANGQTTVTSGNIAIYSGAPLVTETLTQKISEATGDARYAPIGTSGGFGAQSSLASAATTDLGTEATRNVLVTGTTSITSFGTSAVTAAPIYLIEFAGVLTLTQNATSLILPGGANITTAAGDTAEAEYLGSGNWRVRNYTPAGGMLQRLKNLSDLSNLPQALVNLGFSDHLVASAGWWVSPLGLILQWGQVSVAQGAYSSFTLPIAFPTAGLDGVANIKETVAVPPGNAISAYVGTVGTTTITVGHSDTGTAPTSNCNFLCWGF